MSNKKGKLPIWLPYTNEIIVKKDTVFFVFKGGELTISWRRIQSILFYGAVCPIAEDFLQACVRHGIPVCIHRRNMPRAVWITGGFITNRDDILTKQILFREHGVKSLHISRKILLAKIKSMCWLMGKSEHLLNRVQFAKNVDQLRTLEALHAQRYWKRYYKHLTGGRSERRNRDNDVSAALNAVSKLASGVLLRYITYHKLSPYHGFLHVPTDYPSLVYDLMEPYRGYIDRKVFETIEEMHETQRIKENIVSFSNKSVERLFDKKVYTHQTRQIVTFQELLHGSVLALRAYLLGDAKKFIVPIPGKPLGGRPLKVGYRLYGRSAGPTDFAVEAERVAKDWELHTDREEE